MIACSGVEGVVTYMSCVQAFMTGIKIESNNQSPFCKLIKVTSELQNQRIKNAWLQLTFDPCKPSDQEPQYGCSHCVV